MGCTGGFKREDTAPIAMRAAERRELPHVSTYVNEEINSKKRKELAMTQLLRAIDAGFLYFDTVCFCERSERLTNGHKHLLQFQERTSVAIVPVDLRERRAGWKASS